jgi:O-antigen/teichoic acid export membrane protein
MIRAAFIAYAGFAGGFIANVVVARLTGVEGKGIFSLFVATVGGLVTVAAVGLPNGQTYQASKDPQWLRHFMPNAVPLALANGGLVALAYLLGGQALGLAQVTLLGLTGVVACLVAVPVGLLLQFQRQYFLALHRYELAKAEGALAVALPLLGYLGLYVIGRSDVGALVGAYVIAQALSFAFFLLPARRVGPAPGRFSLELARRSLAFGTREWASHIALYLMGRVDFFIVLLYLGPKGLGVYSVAVGVAEITIRLTAEIGTMLFPVFAGGGLRPGQPAVALRSVTLLAVGAAAVLGLASGPFVRILFGPAFADAIPALRWLLVGTVAWSTANVTWPYVSAGGRPGLGVFVFGLAALVDVLLNMALLPRLGVVGASVSATSSYILAAAAFLHFFRKSERCTLREAMWPDASDFRRLARTLLQASGARRSWVP